MDLTFRINEIVNLMYRSVFEPELFPVFLDDISRELGGVGSVFIPLTPQDNSPSYVSKSLVEAVDEYRSNWWQHDPGFIFARNNGFPTGILDGRTLIDHSDLRYAGFYSDFAHRFDFSTFLSITMRPHSDLYLTLGVQRPINSLPASATELKIAKIFHSHFQSIIQIQSNIESQSMMAGLVENAERSCNGIAVVDPYFCVTYANQAMRSLSGQGLMLRNQSGKIKILTQIPSFQAQIDRIIGRAIRRFDPEYIDVSQTIVSIPRPNGTPLLISAVPLMAQTIEKLSLFPHHGNSALVTVVDPEQKIPRVPFEAMQVLGLTRSEAAVAVVVGQGRSPADAASELALATETVRKHLKSVFEKLQIERQSQLSIMVSTLSNL